MEIKGEYINGKLNFNLDDIKQFREEHLSLSQKMHSMIDHILENINSDQEKLEICQVGKFLVLINEGIVIKEKSESPDFIIEMGGKTIGLEHETIRNKKTVRNVGSIRNLIQMVEQYYIITYPNSLTPFKKEFPQCPNMIVDIRFIDDLFSFRKGESSTLSIEIADYIHSIVNEEDFNKPAYISKVTISPHTNVNFIVGNDINKTEKLQLQTLKEFIKKKEAKVNKYKEMTGINEQWLLVVAGSLSRDSYEVEDDFKFVNSGFERIYLLDDFKAKYYRLK